MPVAASQTVPEAEAEFSSQRPDGSQLPLVAQSRDQRWKLWIRARFHAWAQQQLVRLMARRRSVVRSLALWLAQQAER